MTDCKSEQAEFQGLGHRKVVAAFDGGDVTSDAGALLLREGAQWRAGHEQRDDSNRQWTPHVASLVRWSPSYVVVRIRSRVTNRFSGCEHPGRALGPVGSGASLNPGEFTATAPGRGSRGGRVRGRHVCS